MAAKKAQLNANIPPDLRREINAAAKRKGMTLSEYVERVFRSALQAEAAMGEPGFLEALEKLLAQRKPE